MIPVHLPDDLLKRLYVEADRRGVNPELVLSDHLLLGLSIPHNARYIMLSGPALAALEAKLGHGQITSPDDLAQKVDRLARISFGEYEISLSQAQREEMVWRAAKRGITVEKMIEHAWTRIQEQLFTASLGA